MLLQNVQHAAAVRRPRRTGHRPTGLKSGDHRKRQGPPSSDETKPATTHHKAQTVDAAAAESKSAKATRAMLIRSDGARADPTNRHRPRRGAGLYIYQPGPAPLIDQRSSQTASTESRAGQTRAVCFRASEIVISGETRERESMADIALLVTEQFEKNVKRGAPGAGAGGERRNFGAVAKVWSSWVEFASAAASGVRVSVAVHLEPKTGLALAAADGFFSA